jgi:2-furoyl-CoA dehydrogenase FAD binding subunit
VLVDIARIPELDAIRDMGGRIEVGAAVTQNKLLSWPKLAEKLPLVAVALPNVGHFQTRNKGTVCGSIAHADPSSELPLSLALLEGEVVLRSKRGSRTVGARSFQLDMLTTAREPDELIVAVRFPIAATRKAAFREVARRHGDFAIIAIGAVIEDENTARIGIGGIASKPVVRRVPLNEAKDAVSKLADELEGYEDLHASAELRRDILRNLGPVVIEEAQACAA